MVLENIIWVMGIVKVLRGPFHICYLACSLVRIRIWFPVSIVNITNMDAMMKEK